MFSYDNAYMKFSDGERVHFIDRKGRQYPLTLYSGKVFQFSGEKISHDEIIGQDDGTTVTLSRGSKFIVLKPTLSEFILKMPRGAQVIYPKDIGTIIMCGDIYPSARVVEAGVDRIILDLPEPWGVVPHAVQSLREGGIFLCYLPTILQVSTVVRALKESGSFIQIETSETLVRTWHVEDNSVRPDHRMVAHTGFITTARKVLVTKDCHVNHHEPGLTKGNENNR